ncbi:MULTISPECIES: exosome complex RNA-binding protein Csl4 [Acidianus]|uniref:Exosome complex component Csl4 n=1 Tax=Candidatus Acidianus copahuensis TaxID=1160895 RepID=A0A031LQD5_9CREN|nr:MULTISPECIES: exosome complex RNA-binding protein Csl4 [Acidianus]EZQ06950.1 RNA-binding protein [Candidatus Acidianus copahuensis]NON62355.1 exosome complex RNA-binding protein Csl4 [Acidianus sp. RZ1]
MRTQGEITFPGEELGVIEEFIPGENTYEEDGFIRSASVGKVFYDMINRRSNVISTKKSAISGLKKARYVYGTVISIKEDSALVNISSIEDKFVTLISGILHVSQVSGKYIETITDAVKLGDIIRAKPITFASPVYLTLKGKDLGVVLASCSICGHLMIKADEEHLKCPNCGNVEKRKIGNYMVKRNGS